VYVEEVSLVLNTLQEWLCRHFRGLLCPFSQIYSPCWFTSNLI